jgi:hypothetical protein
VPGKSPAWLKIVLAAIPVIGVLVVGYWQYVRHPASVTYTGRVQEVGSLKPIYGAKVSVEADQKVPQILYTDSEGIFHVELSGEANAVRIEVAAEGYDSFDRNVTVARTGIEPVRLTPISKEFCVTVGKNPSLANVAEMLAHIRHIRVNFSRCTNRDRSTIVEFNGGELCGKTDKLFLEEIRTRTSINYVVAVIEDGSSYEIDCR